MPSDPPPTIAVIGAGIVGTAIAYQLQRQNPARRVVLIDRDKPGMGASFGNMASIAATEFLPASRPAIWAQVPKWVLDPEGPMRLRLGYLPWLLPWMARFVAASRPSRVRALGQAGAALCQRALADTEAMLASAGLSQMLSERGCLCLLDKPSEAASNAEHLRLLEQTGFAFETLTPQQVAELEPALHARLSAVLRFPDNRSISDPHGLVCALVEAFCGLGGTLVHGCVDRISRRDGAVEAVQLSDGRSIQAEQIILCAGVQTAALSRALGEPIPLETERGYHSQIMAPGISLNHALIWPARAFMVTPTAGGLRVGGTVELGGLKRPPDYRRAKILVRHAQEVLPDLKAKQVSEWMGHRPATPDTIPVIGLSAKTKGLLYATGHGHLGLTNAATTAQIVAALVSDRPPPLDIAPYRVDRF